MKILIMGLPGSGKTTLATQLHQDITNQQLTVEWFNADKIREEYDDWDFSEEGRLRQATRMRKLAETSTATFVISDFVCPTPELRDAFKADVTIWVDTISAGRFEDTNRVFVPPMLYDIRVTEQDCEKWSSIIINLLFTLLPFYET